MAEHGPPPKPPGQGLRWARYEDVVERQVRNALSLWESMIEAEPDPRFRRALERPEAGVPNRNRGCCSSLLCRLLRQAEGADMTTVCIDAFHGTGELWVTVGGANQPLLSQREWTRVSIFKRSGHMCPLSQQSGHNVSKTALRVEGGK
jgi:hypothetical protein